MGRESYKSLRGYFEILFALEKGEKCGVATLDREGYIRRFQQATGQCITLRKSSKGTPIYTVKLCK